MHSSQNRVFGTKKSVRFSSVAALAKDLQFYWSSSVAVAIVLGARGTVPVVCSVVLLKGSEAFVRDLAKAASPGSSDEAMSRFTKGMRF